MNSKRFITNIIYRLKRRYGEVVDVLELTNSVLDTQTGEKTNTYDSVRVDRAIVLPSRINKEFVYDLSYIAASKDFTMGGLFDTTKRKILFDKADLTTWTLTNNQFLVTKDTRYEILEVHEFDYAFIAVGKQIVDHPLNNVINVNVYSYLGDMTQEVTSD